MSKIILGEKSEEIKNTPMNAFEHLGIDFSCHTGICGICKIKVLKGKNNINPKTDPELDFPLEDDERLACQCLKIKGDIEIESVN